MSRVITQTGEVVNETTVTLTQGGGMEYAITFKPGQQITLVVISHDPPKRLTLPKPDPEVIPF